MAMGVVQSQTNDSLMACDQQGRKEVGSSLGPRGNMVLSFIDMGPLLSVTVENQCLLFMGFGASWPGYYQELAGKACPEGQPRPTTSSPQSPAA